MNKSRLVLLLLPLIFVLPAGCSAIADAGAVAGASALAYCEGTVTTIEGRDLEQMWVGSQAALQKMGYSITSTERESFGGRIIARALRDQRILVELKSITANTTNITIKVGNNFGDEKSARIVLQGILTNFPVTAPSFLPEVMPVQAGSPSVEPRAQQVSPAPAGITPDADATKVGGAVPNK